MRSKSFQLLCLTLATCHLASAATVPVWPNVAQSSGIHAETDGANLINSANYGGAEQYFQQQVQAQSQLVASPPTGSSESGAVQQPQYSFVLTEPTNQGVKGIGRLFRKKTQQPQLIQLVPNPALLASQPENLFANSGYLEAPVSLVNSTGSDVKGGGGAKNKLRKLLPWNWVFTKSTTADQPSQQVQDQANPKRYGTLSGGHLCLCNQQYPSYSPAPIVEVFDPSNSHSNDYHHGVESNPVPKVVPAPQPSPVKQQQQPQSFSLPVLTQHQQPQTSEQVSSTGEQVGTQQVPFGYQTSGGTYVSNVNQQQQQQQQQSIPASTNFQEGVAQTGGAQVSSGNGN